MSWGVITAVLLLTRQQAATALDLGRQVAEEGTVLQRRAHAIRLREFRTYHPDLPGLSELIEIIEIIEPPATSG